MIYSAVLVSWVPCVLLFINLKNEIGKLGETRLHVIVLRRQHFEFRRYIYIIVGCDELIRNFE